MLPAVLHHSPVALLQHSRAMWLHDGNTEQECHRHPFNRHWRHDVSFATGKICEDIGRGERKETQSKGETAILKCLISCALHTLKEDERRVCRYNNSISEQHSVKEKDKKEKEEPV